MATLQSICALVVLNRKDKENRSCEKESLQFWQS
jgi:hypothetical protein